MDRPEWIAVHPRSGEVYCSLTNNSARGKGKPALRDRASWAPTPPTRAPPTCMGHIVRWREAGGDAAATSFTWDIFLQAGDPDPADPLKRGNVRGGVAFAQPDGLTFDERGIALDPDRRLGREHGAPTWTASATTRCSPPTPPPARSAASSPAPSAARSPASSFTPDLRTMFVNIQHPGEAPDASPAATTPAAPKPTAPGPTAPQAAAPARRPSRSAATTAASSAPEGRSGQSPEPPRLLW